MQSALVCSCLALVAFMSCATPAGSQSLRICSGASSSEVDHSCWKRVSVASIGLKGPLSLQLPLPVGPHQVDDDDGVQALHAQEALDLMQGWTWVTKVTSLRRSNSGLLFFVHALHVDGRTAGVRVHLSFFEC